MTFLLVALVVIVSPGPDFALPVRHTLLAGRAGGVATVAGVDRASDVGAGGRGGNRGSPRGVATLVRRVALRRRRVPRVPRRARTSARAGAPDVRRVAGACARTRELSLSPGAHQQSLQPED